MEGLFGGPVFPLRVYGAQLAQSLPELVQSFLEKKIKKRGFYFIV